MYIKGRSHIRCFVDDRIGSPQSCQQVHALAETKAAGEKISSVV